MENFLDCGKLTFLNEGKKGLIILKINANVETIYRYAFNREQKLSSLTYFTVNKIIIIFSRILMRNIKPLMRGSNKNIFILSQNKVKSCEFIKVFIDVYYKQTLFKRKIQTQSIVF